ncbi:unnamed protein product [Prorocentrum cordatum]|uniref:Protein kinase domain-containing protein n=1 Tax=Prorocentrum cordatum TaxID=2364126 RepID=A0ABN9S592_9DINO|nr:unnamed protein product [Polarella glacialis]
MLAAPGRVCWRSAVWCCGAPSWRASLAVPRRARTSPRPLQRAMTDQGAPYGRTVAGEAFAAAGCQKPSDVLSRVLQAPGRSIVLPVLHADVVVSPAHSLHTYLQQLRAVIRTVEVAKPQAQGAMRAFYVLPETAPVPALKMALGLGGRVLEVPDAVEERCRALPRSVAGGNIKEWYLQSRRSYQELVRLGLAPRFYGLVIYVVKALPQTVHRLYQGTAAPLTVHSSAVPAGCYDFPSFVAAYFHLDIGSAMDAMFPPPAAEAAVHSQAAHYWAVWCQYSFYGDSIVTVLGVQDVNGTPVASLPWLLDSPWAREHCRQEEWVSAPELGWIFLTLLIRVIFLASVVHEEFLLGDVHGGNLCVTVHSEARLTELKPVWIDFGGSLLYAEVATLQLAWRAFDLGAQVDAGFGISGVQGSSSVPGPFQGQELAHMQGVLQDLLDDMSAEGRLSGSVSVENVAAESAIRARHLQFCHYFLGEFFDKIAGVRADCRVVDVRRGLRFPPWHVEFPPCGGRAVRHHVGAARQGLHEGCLSSACAGGRQFPGARGSRAGPR